MRETIGSYPAGIDRAFIHLVGTIVTWWARTEGLMVHDLRWLRSLELVKEAVEQESFPAQTRRVVKHWGKLLRAVYGSDEKKLADLAEVLTESFELLEHRKAIVHSFWPYGQDKPGIIRLSSIRPKQGDDSKLIITSYTTTIDELDDVNERMSRLYHRVMMFSMNSLRETRKWPTRGDKAEG